MKRSIALIVLSLFAAALLAGCHPMSSDHDVKPVTPQ
jgi:hypothetical protein